MVDDEENHGVWSEKDIIIALIGPTNSGKSTFVENAAGIEGISRGALGSNTTEISVVKFPFPGLVDSSICLIDTPGFAGITRGVKDIAKMISDWLNNTYNEKQSLAGLVYFQPISDNPIIGLSSILNNFKRLCENELNRMSLTISMCDGVDEASSAMNKNIINTTWQPLIAAGMSVKCFLNSTESALDTLRPLVRAALKRQRTIGRVLRRGRSLATSPIKSLQQEEWIGNLMRVAQSKLQDEQPAIIVLHGPSGCGKSQFIDCLTLETSWANRTNQLLSVHSVCPVNVNSKSQNKNNSSVLLVDAPGFDKGYNWNADNILEDIYLWLIQNYGKGARVAGILCFQDISDDRWIKPPRKSLLKKLAGANAIAKLIFVMTQWDLCEVGEAVDRERRLKHLLTSFLLAGARFDRFDKKTETAWKILEPLL